MPDGTPTYIQIDNTGKVTAIFDGVIVGRPGSTVPATVITGQLTDAQISALAAAKVTGQLTDAQIAALAAAKITGQLTDAQLADIAAGKITGQIGTTQISPGAITTGLLAANAVVANKIAANVIDGDKLNFVAATLPSPPTAQQIDWIAASDGAMIAAVRGLDSVGAISTGQAALVANPNGTRATGEANLIGVGSGVGSTSLVRVRGDATGGLNSVVAHVNGSDFTVIDDGSVGVPPSGVFRSNFFQVGLGGTPKRSVSSKATCLFSGSSPASNAVVVVIPGATGKVIAVASARFITSGGPGGGYYDEATVLVDDSANNGSVSIYVESRGGTVPIANSVCDIFFIAWEA